MVTFHVGNLAKKPEGASEHHTIDEAIDFDPLEHIATKSPFHAQATFLKLPYEIHVELKDASVDVNCQCGRCLKSFSRPIRIPYAEREFLINLPDSQKGDDEDSFFVDQKYWTISLLEMIRQEILLHFPVVPVCFEGCRGLCDQCGANLNEHPCKCAKSVT